MAAPPLPQTPSNQQLQTNSANAVAAHSPSTPQSPGSSHRERERVALILTINVELLTEVNRLQKEEKGGAISPQQALNSEVPATQTRWRRTSTFNVCGACRRIWHI